MKKAISVLLAVVLSVSQLALCAEAASNPLQASDRITQQLAETTARKQEIEAERIQRENMKRAAFKYGQTADTSNNLGFILNRKTMTKREYEAFKWSFILSQFAVPLEDSLLDVFSQKYFNDMIEANMDIAAVQDVLQYGGANPNDIKVTASMLQDANFNDIVDTIRSNYSLLYLYKENGNPITLADLLYGGSAVNERFYVYDTVLQATGNSSIEELNALYYQQEKLADKDNLPDYKISDPLRIPVAIYDASFYFYLQLAVGTYCLKNSTSVLDIESLYGTAQMVIDSYGNICVYTATGAKIVMPNFGNSLFINVLDVDNGAYLNQIDLYNKWVTTLYTRSKRTHVGSTSETSDVFGEFSPVALGGGSRISIDDDTLENNEESEQVIRGQYVSELVVKNGSGDLSNTMILVDPADIFTSGISIVDWIENKLIDTKGYDEYPFSPTHYDGKIKFPLDDRSENIYTDIGAIMHESFAYGPKKDHEGWRLGIKGATGLDDLKYSTYIGTIYSNINCEDIAGKFTHSLCTVDNDIFINPFPIINNYINLASLDIKTNSGKTHYYKVAMSLLKGTWLYSVKDGDNSRKEVLLFSGTEGENSAQEYLQAINNCLTMVTTFSKDQLVTDYRFVSYRAATQDNGNEYSELYLPMNVINVGQNCSAFVGEEKGMFVAQHRDYFSSDMQTYRNLMSSYFKDIANTASNSWGADIFINTGVNFKFSNDKLILQSSKSKDSIGNINLPFLENIFIGFGNVPSTYVRGLPVAITIPAEVPPNYLAWFGEEIEVNTSETTAKDVTDYYDLHKYFKSVWTALGKPSEMYFSTNLCVGSLGVDPNDNTPYQDKEHTDANSMRKGGIKFVVTHGTEEISEVIYDTWGLKFFNGEENFLDNVGKLISEITGDDKLHFSLTDKETGEGYWELGSSAVEDIAEADMIELRDLTNSINFMTLCGNAYKRLDLKQDSSIASFKAWLKGECAAYDLDVNEVLYAMSMFQHGAIADELDNAISDVYFFDEYQYLLRNTSVISGTPGSSNSLDFATFIYYWDRAYLPDLTFNKNMTEHISELVGATSKDSASALSAYSCWLSYEEYLEINGVTRIQYPFKKFLEDNYRNGGLNIPFTQELTLQTKSLSEFIEANSDIQRYFDFKSQVYNYLDPDTIIAYPAAEYIGGSIYIQNGLADVVLARNQLSMTSEEQQLLNSSGIIEGYDTMRLIMALQCNTDYEHNYLTVSPVKAAEVQHVSKEELMDKANQFFDNPVSSLSYIFAGFLYKAHTAVATGSLGNVFSATWLVESSIYKWIMARYIAIVTIIVVVLLLIKLTQFAMSKTRDYWSIGRAVAGILAMCMVPLLVFNGFIWAFDATSQWALAGPTNKMLLSEVNASVLDRVNNDPGVTAEFNAFREQFDGIQGEYKGLTFEEIEDYSLDGPVYRQVPLTSYMTYLQFGTDKKTWYTTKGFYPVNIDHYDESMFYYFYDYIRTEFFDYVAKNANQSMSSATYLAVLDECQPALAISKDSDQYDKLKEAWIKITSAEAGLAEQSGEFIAMLEDTGFVYDNSINPQLSERYGGAYAKDLAGVYNLFSLMVNKGSRTIEETNTMAKTYAAIKASPWRQAMDDARIMAASDGINPKLWTDQSVIAEFMEEEQFKGNARKEEDNIYPIMTSRLDLFNPSLNSSSGEVDMRYNDLVLTPLEEKLCNVTTAIYEDTLKALEYHKSEIKNESAIQLMAWIATFRVSEAFGLEPTAPIPQTVTLDTIIRTAFVKDLDTISSNANTMYTLVEQGDSIGKLVLVLLLETSIAIAGVLRIFIILYLTVASFVILGLRLLHKAPQTTDLIYGIVGNVLALLALHALTLFLVVVAVEWVANATNNIPGLVLDLVMIAFSILMCVFLFRLVKNLVKDAINLGGAKIKAGVHSIAGKIASMITHTVGINALASQMQGTEINLNADSVAEQNQMQEQMANEQAQRNRERIERITNTLNDVETEEELRERETASRATSGDMKIARNLAAESDVAGVANLAVGAIQAKESGQVSPELVQSAASMAASMYGGPAAGAAVTAVFSTGKGQEMVDKATNTINKVMPKK